MTDFYRVKELSDAIKKSEVSYGTSSNEQLLPEILEMCQPNTILTSPEKKYIYGLCLLYCDRIINSECFASNDDRITELSKTLDILTGLGGKALVYRNLVIIYIIELQISQLRTNSGAIENHNQIPIDQLDSIDSAKLRSDYPDLFIRFQSLISLFYFKTKDFISFEKNVNKGIEIINELTNMANHNLLSHPRVFRAGIVLQNLNSELLFRNGKWNQSARSRLSALSYGLKSFENDKSDLLFNDCLRSLIVLLLITSIGARKLINLNEFIALIKSNSFIHDKIDPKILGIFIKLYKNDIVDLQQDFIPVFTIDFLKEYKFTEIDADGFTYPHLIQKGIKSIIEHNIRSISKVFLNININHLKPLMNCSNSVASDERIEEILFDLILNNNLSAEIDQVRNFVVFKETMNDTDNENDNGANNGTGNEMSWDNRINSFFEEFDILTKLIK